jgi:N-acetylglucosaminyldiphosphoundecaprenol N-acetyl-beta-D-mannosaminyltransferase
MSATSTPTQCRHQGAVPHGPAVNRIRFDSHSPEELLASIDAFLACGQSHVVHFFAGHSTVLARSDEAYREVANRGDLNIADGASVALALRLLGARGRRITGSDAFRLVPAWGLERGLKHCLYGSTPGVIARLCAKLDAAHPGIEIVDAYSPPFAFPELLDLEAAAEHMRRAGADVVWVGLGVPKQDLVAERLRELEAAPVIMCVGAAFDFVSGAKRRAPVWMRKSGLEWVHRLVQEPRRLWRRYIFGHPRFVAGVLADYMRGRRFA